MYRTNPTGYNQEESVLRECGSITAHMSKERTSSYTDWLKVGQLHTHDTSYSLKLQLFQLPGNFPMKLILLTI